MNRIEPNARRQDAADEAPAAGTSKPISGRQRFLDACGCRPVDRPPLWLMRQAGRALPEYRLLKEKYSFLELVRTPELATEVTLQPIRRFGFDAAILFSDILVVPEALGQAYQFRDGGGISMEFAVRSAREIERLELGGLTERLDYVRQSLRLLKQTLGPDTALIGFAGSPWTLACFMVEGGSASQFRAAASLLDQEPVLFGRLLETLTRAVAAYLRLQLEAGVDAIQIFDTLAGLLPRERFQEASARWLTDIVRGLREGGPTHPPAIVFSKGMNDNWEALLGTGASVFSVDSSVRLRDLRARLPGDVALQGNLDPALLRTSSEQVTDAARELLEDLRGCRGHIFNLGHGVPPDARLECLEALASTVQSFT